MGGDGRILLDVDSGDFAIIVPNTKFLMFYNCFGYLYYSICSPREERLGIFAIYIININLLYQSQSPRALEPLKDTNKIGYTYQLHTYNTGGTIHVILSSILFLWCRFRCRCRCRRLLFCSMISSSAYWILLPLLCLLYTGVSTAAAATLTLATLTIIFT